MDFAMHSTAGYYTDIITLILSTDYIGRIKYTCD